MSNTGQDISPDGVITLNLADSRNWIIFWEAAKVVSTTTIDFYVSDRALTEVYLLHHHDKIVISIPDTQTRQRLVRIW